MEEDALLTGLEFFDSALGGFRRGRLHLLISASGIGEHLLYRTAVASITRLRGYALFVDCGNVFSPYEIGRISMERGVEAREMLQRIRVSRPFTAYQLSILFEDGGGVDEELQGGPIFLALLRPLNLIYSEDVAERDARLILRRMLRRLRDLVGRGVTVLVTHRKPLRRHLTQLAEASDYVYLLQTFGRNRVRINLEKNPERVPRRMDFFLTHGAQTTLERFAGGVV